MGEIDENSTLWIEHLQPKTHIKTLDADFLIFALIAGGHFK